MIKIVVNPKYHKLEKFVEDIPREFIKTGEIVYSARNIIKIYDVEGYKVNIKSFKKPLLINQLVYAVLRASKAKRSYMYALKLIERGFSTPDPIAYIERRRGLLLKYSFYISIHEDFDGMMRELRQGTLDEKAELIKQFAWYTAKLHDNKILHIDYSPGNILYKLVDGTYSFYLVDLNRMIFDKDISLNTACFNFRRLWGSDEMIELFVSEYAKARNFDVDTCLRKTFEYRTQFWTKFTKQYPGVTPYDK